VLNPDVASSDSLGYVSPAMPRQARLDAPGVLHHVMVRGIERRAIFRDDADRAEFVARLAALVREGGGSPSTPGRSSRLMPTFSSGRGGGRSPGSCARSSPRSAGALQPAPPAHGPGVPEPGQVDRGGRRPLPPRVGPLPPPEPPPGGGAPRGRRVIATPGPATAPCWGPRPAPGKPRARSSTRSVWANSNLP